MPDHDNSLNLQQQVRDAMHSAASLCIRGGNTKNFYGNNFRGESLDVSSHSGIVSYEPTELVITVRAGTTLNEIKTALAAQNQMLAFEPPGFGEAATIGGTIACNFSGPRRPYAGAARDFLLGCKIINGKAGILGFGGQVMKNVAGYDVSRLMAGALGTLGVILEVSLKVLPKPETEVTLVLSAGAEEALQKVHQWQRLPIPVSASVFDGKQLHVRLSGTADTVNQAKRKLGGDEVPNASVFWENIREHRSPFFDETADLWRISVPSNTPPLALSGAWLYDWGGAQRWLKTEHAASVVRTAAQQAGGHATLFRGNHSGVAFQELPEGLLKIHRNLKHAFDPHGLFNRGRLYRDI